MRYSIILQQKKLKPVLSVVVLIVTTIIFISYFRVHPEILHIFSHISVAQLLALLGLYLIFMGSLVLVQRATLQIADVNIQPTANILLTVYSSIVNFFGPLQSGPAFRAAYLKKRYSMSLKSYLWATLLYYAVYAALSGSLLIVYFIGPLLTILLISVMVSIMLYAVSKLTLLNKYLPALTRSNVLFLIVATSLQVAALIFIYYAELHIVSPATTIRQAVSYTGAANFALFVSFTPGAIGFRESFLVLSQAIHHITNNTIVAASIIDRSTYIVLLGVLGVAAAATHTKGYLLQKGKS